LRLLMLMQSIAQPDRWAIELAAGRRDRVS
jgi:hypothetical protein